VTSFCFIFSGIFEVAVGRAELSDTAHPLLVWAAPYHEMIGPFASLYAACYGGVAARHHLDIARAETSFRRAFEIGCGVALIRMPRASPVRFSANCSTRQAIWPQPCVCWTRAMGSVPRAAEWTTCRAVRESVRAFDRSTVIGTRRWSACLRV